MKEEADQSLQGIYNYIVTLGLSTEQMDTIADMIREYGLNKYKQGMYDGGDITINELRSKETKI